MALATSVASLIPGMMTLSLVGKTSQMIPRYLGPQKRGRKKPTKNMIRGFTEIMMGVPMIGATSNLISGL